MGFQPHPGPVFEGASAFCFVKHGPWKEAGTGSLERLPHRVRPFTEAAGQVGQGFGLCRVGFSLPVNGAFQPHSEPVAKIYQNMLGQ